MLCSFWCFVEVKQNSTITVDTVPVFRAASTQILLLSLCHVLCVVSSQGEYSLILPEDK